MDIKKEFLTCDVMIAGGGVGGLTCALELKKKDRTSISWWWRSSSPVTRKAQQGRRRARILQWIRSLLWIF